MCAVWSWLLPWWSVAVVCYMVSRRVAQSRAKAFLMGFLGIAVFWLIAVLIRDIGNDHILSARMAELFHLPVAVFIGVNVLLGGLVGGVGAWVGALMRRSKANNND